MFENINSIVKEIEKSFGFLFSRGYRVSHAEYSPQFNQSWVVEIEAEDFNIFITNDRNEILLEFSPINSRDPQKRISFEELASNLSKGSTIIEPFQGNLAWGRKKQLIRWSKLLETFINQIELHFKKLQV